MRLRIRGLTILTIIPFLGAGWGWPWWRCGKWYVGVYFHCKRGLYLGIGWDDIERRIGNRVKAMTPEARAELRTILEKMR